MADHECYIGMLYTCDDRDWVTEQDVLDHIEQQTKFNEYCGNMALPLRRPVWSMEEYADWRRSTDLKRFKFCPECGNKIDWKKIKDGGRNGQT